MTDENKIETIRILLDARDEMSCEVLRAIVDAIYILVKE